MSELNEKIAAILDNSISATSWNDQDGLHQEVSGTEQAAKAIEILVLERELNILKGINIFGEMPVVLIDETEERLNQLKQQ